MARELRIAAFASIAGVRVQAIFQKRALVVGGLDFRWLVGALASSPVAYPLGDKQLAPRLTGRC